VDLWDTADSEVELIGCSLLLIEFGGAAGKDNSCELDLNFEKGLGLPSIKN